MRNQRHLHLALLLPALLSVSLAACGGSAPADLETTEQTATIRRWTVTYQGAVIGRFVNVEDLEDGDRIVILEDGWLETWTTPRDVDLHLGNLTWHLFGAVHNGKGNTAMQEEIEMVIERLERG